MDLHLHGKRVLITGASKGIGAAAAEAFAAEGCHLHLAARNAGLLEALADRLRGRHQIDVTIHPVDLRQPEQLAALADAADEIDILVILMALDAPSASSNVLALVLSNAPISAPWTTSTL